MRHLSVVVLGALALTACDAGKSRLNQSGRLSMQDSKTTTTAVAEPTDSLMQSEEATPTTTVPSGSSLREGNISKSQKLNSAVVAPAGKSIKEQKDKKSTSTPVVVPVNKSSAAVVGAGAAGAGIVNGNDMVRDPNVDRMNAQDSDEMQAQEAPLNDETYYNEPEEEVYSDDMQAQEVVPRAEARKTYNEMQISDDEDDYPLEPDHGGETYNEFQRNVE